LAVGIDAQTERRAALVSINKRMWAFLVLVTGPLLALIHLAQQLTRPSWQFQFLFVASLVMWASWGLGYLSARKGGVETPAMLLMFTAGGHAALVLCLRQASLGPAAITFVAGTVYGWLFWPALLPVGTLLWTIVIVVAEALIHFGALKQVASPPALQLLYDIGMLAIIFPVIGYLLQLVEKVIDVPFRKLVESSEQQRSILETVSQAQPHIQDLVAHVERLSMTLASEATDQALTIEQVLSSTEQLQAMLREAEAAAEETRGIAEGTRENSIRSGEWLSSIEDELNGFLVLLGNVGQSVQRLSQQSQSAGEILGYVREVDRRVNTLAVNAAVEASHAREAGKGFQVVATELREMLDRNTENVKRGAALLEAIQRDGADSIREIRASSEQLRLHLADLRTAGSLVRKIIASFTETSRNVDAVATTADEQQRQVLQVAEAMRLLRDSAGLLQDSAGELSGSLKRLSRSQATLKKVVEHYQRSDITDDDILDLGEALARAAADALGQET
jgi:methyl-accepting chemotaxis protein